MPLLLLIFFASAVLSAATSSSLASKLTQMPFSEAGKEPVIYVDSTNGIDSPFCGSLSFPCATVRQSASNAPPYALLILLPGVYDCGCRIGKPLSLVGSGSPVFDQLFHSNERPLPTGLSVFDCSGRKRALWFDEVVAKVDGVHFRNGFGEGSGCILATQSFDRFFDSHLITRSTFYRCTGIASTAFPNVGGAIAIVQKVSKARPFEVVKSNFHRNYARSTGWSAGGLAVAYTDPPYSTAYTTPYPLHADPGAGKHTQEVEDFFCDQYSLDPPPHLEAFGGLFTRVTNSKITVGGMPVYNSVGGITTKKKPDVDQEGALSWKNIKWLTFCASTGNWGITTTNGLVSAWKDIECNCQLCSNLPKSSKRIRYPQNLRGFTFLGGILEHPLQFKCHQPSTMAYKRPAFIKKKLPNGMPELRLEEPLTIPDFDAPPYVVREPLPKNTQISNHYSTYSQCTAVFLSQVPIAQAARQGTYVEVPDFLRHGRPVFWNTDRERAKDGGQWLWYCANAMEWIFTDDNPLKTPISDHEERCHRGIASVATHAPHPALVPGWKIWDGHWKGSPASRFGGISVNCAIPPPRPSVPLPSHICSVVEMKNSPIPSEAPFGPYVLIPGLNHNHRPVYRSTLGATSSPIFVWYCNTFGEYVVSKDLPWPESVKEMSSRGINSGDLAANFQHTNKSSPWSRPYFSESPGSFAAGSKASGSPPFGPTSEDLIQGKFPPDDVCVRALSSHTTHSSSPDGPLTWAFINGDDWYSASAATGFHCVHRCPTFSISQVQLPDAHGIYTVSGEAFGSPVFRRITGERHLLLRLGECGPWGLFATDSVSKIPFPLDSAGFGARISNSAEGILTRLRNSTCDDSGTDLSALVEAAVLISELQSPTSLDQRKDAGIIASQLFHGMSSQHASHPLGVFSWRLGGRGEIALKPSTTFRQPSLHCEAYSTCSQVNVTLLPSSFGSTVVPSGLLGVYYRSSVAFAGRPTFIGTVALGNTHRNEHPAIFYCPTSERWIIGVNSTLTTLLETHDPLTVPCPGFLGTRSTLSLSPTDGGILWDRIISAWDFQRKPIQSAKIKFHVADVPMILSCSEPFSSVSQALQLAKSGGVSAVQKTAKSSGFDSVAVISQCNFTDNAALGLSYHSEIDHSSAQPSPMESTTTAAGAVTLHFGHGPTGDDHHAILKKLTFTYNEATPSTRPFLSSGETTERPKTIDSVGQDDRDPHILNPSVGGIAFIHLAQGSRRHRHTHTLADITVTHNEGNVGGILFKGTSALMHKVNMKRNVALQDGGGFLVMNSNITMSGSACSFNFAAHAGGCANFDHLSRFTATRSDFINNSAKISGTTIASEGFVAISESHVERMTDLAITGAYVSLSSSELSCLTGQASGHVGGFGCVPELSESHPPVEVLPSDDTESWLIWASGASSMVAQGMLTLTMIVFGYQHFIAKPPVTSRKVKR